jgi:hypothetical protein
MPSYRPDPGGNFASDAHRRVLAVVANDDVTRVPFDEVVSRVDADDQVDLSSEEVAEILKDLEADGDVDKTDEGYDATVVGLETIQGPIADDGGRKHGA